MGVDASIKSVVKRGGALREHWDVIALAGIVLLGGWLRCSRLELMEFKGDEWKLYKLAVEQASGKVQLAGLISSVGVHNPPMATYLFSVPALFAGEPVVFAWLPACLNTIAVAGTYLLARMWVSRTAALTAALLFAVSPSAVLMSRKIWAQDLLAFFTVSFFLMVALWLRERRMWQAVAAALALSILNQIHYATLALWPVVAFAAWRGRGRGFASQGIVSAAAYMALWAPFGVFLWREAEGELRNYKAAYVSPSIAAASAIEGAAWEAKLMGRGAVDEALGPGRFGLSGRAIRYDWLNVLFGVYLAGGFAATLTQVRKHGDLWVLVLWLAAPPIILAFRVFHFHYFVVSYPGSFVAGAVLVDALAAWLTGRAPRRIVRMAALTATAGLAVVVCVEVGYFRGFLGYVDATGGTAGDYGITYREKARVAKYLAETVPSGHFDLIDASGPIPSPDTYEFLYRMEGGRGVAAWQPEEMGSTSIMTYVVTAPKVRGRKSWDEARAANATKTQIGPMSIVRVRRRVDAGGAAQ